MTQISESGRQTPVAEEFDVLVCGGGPAGIGAALASARAGARTGLVESQGCLGGVWTTGCLTWILDHDGKPGLMREIMDRLHAAGARATFQGTPTNAFEPEFMKLLLDELCADAGVHVRLYHLLAGAVTDGQRLTHAIVESKSGRQALAAKVFVDCTGDGDLGARAGCGFDLGREGTGETQPMSLLALVAGLDPVAAKPYFRYANEVPWGEPKQRLRRDMEAGGRSPSYARPTLFWIRDDLFFLMANHEYGRSAVDAVDLGEATIRARRELHELVNGLRSLGGVWQNLRLVATGGHIGVREGRRLHGRYTVTVDDLIAGARHSDAVCRVTFGIDVHATAGDENKGIEPSPVRTQPYDIPLGALIARDVDGLLMAGRCISGDFLAHSSYRVTGNSVALGEAAGKVAALAATSGRLPHEVPWPAD